MDRMCVTITTEEKHHKLIGNWQGGVREREDTLFKI